ncbi:unnamed protein product [Ectocarpus sp. 4 AP-2014]
MSLDLILDTPFQLSRARTNSVCATGASSVMIRSLFALGGVVLFIFVVVPLFFVWILSSVYIRAMNVPRLSNVLRPLSLTGLGAGSPAPLPEPADVAPAPPRASGENAVMSGTLVTLEDTGVPDNLVDAQAQLILVPPRLSTRSPARPASPVDVAPAPPQSSGGYRAAGGGSAWSTRGRIVEGFLSAVALVYMLRAWAYRLSALETNLFGFILVVSLTPVVASGFSELRQLWNDSSVVNGRTSDEERNGTLPEYPVLDGVDLFEYDYFQKRYFGDAGKLAGVGVPLLLQLSTVVLLFSFFGESLAIALAYVILDKGKLYRPRFDCDLLFSKLKDLCVNQPTSRPVRAFLLAGGTIYAVLLHLSPVPSKWTWSLIVTHSIRLLTVLVALRGHNQGVADAGAEIVAHVSEVA